MTTHGAMGELDATLDDQLDAAVRATAERLVRLSHDLHAHPEVAFQEAYAAERISQLVESAGYKVHVGRWGLETSLHTAAGHGSPSVAFFAEYDALPGLGHACGHNVIAATSIGAFLGLASVVKQTGGRCVLIGSPAEEGGGGKDAIVRAGGLDDVDAAMMVHPAGYDAAQCDFAGLRQVRVTFRGEAMHAAQGTPDGANALDAAVSAYQSIAQLRQHLRAGDSVHGVITDGGLVPNVIPARTQMHYFLRASTRQGLRRLSERVGEVFSAAALATRTAADITWDENPPYHPMRNNETLARTFVESFSTTRTIPLHTTNPSGSTDMGNVSQVVPSIHPKVAIAPAGVEPHTSAFAEWAVSAEADEAIVDGAVALARTALRYLTDEQLRSAVHDDFTATAAAEEASA